MKKAPMRTPWTRRQKEHFEHGLETYGRMYGDDSPFHTAMTSRLLATAGIVKGMKVLDIGCGVGRTTIPLLQAGCHVTGLEISPSTLKLLQERIEALDLAQAFEARQSAAEDLDEKDSYDLVLGRGILHHLEDPVAVLKLVRNALRPGGKAVFMDPNPLQPAWLAFITLHPALSWRIESGVFRHTPWNNRRIFSLAGFSETYMEFIGIVPPIFWRLDRIAQGMEKVFTKMPWLRGMSLYTVTEVKRST